MMLRQYRDNIWNRQATSGKKKRRIVNNVIQFQQQDMKKAFKSNQIGVLPHNSHGNTPLHQHDFFEMVYVHEGYCDNMIDNKKVSLTKGDICLINTYAVHTLLCDDPDNAVIFNIMIGAEMMNAAHFRLLSYNDFVADFFFHSLEKQRNDDNYLIFHQSEKENAANNLCVQLINEYYGHEEDLYQESKILHLFDCILIELTRSYQKMKDHPLGKKDSLKVSDMIYYIENHYNSVTLKSIADYFGYHPKHFSRIIYQATGQTFTDLLLDLRMRWAKELLQNNSLSITEIMHQVGYHNYKWFSNQFQKKFDMSPKKYRDTV